MFKVNEYRIVFKRRWCQPGRHTDICVNRFLPKKVPCGCNKILKLNGRYDTVCEIYTRDRTMTCLTRIDGLVYRKEPTFTGVAKLHPNDQPDKIIGKKIALRNATKDWDKVSRTLIWTHFWGWVADWKKV